MKIKAVEMMRNIRNKLSSEVNQMTWQEEANYLNNQIKNFQTLTKQKNRYVSKPA